MIRRDSLLALPRRALAEALAAGHPIDPAALDGSEYRGISLGLPAFVEKLSWKTFQKVFERDRESGTLRGWNVRIEQRGLDASSVPKQKNGAPFTFGHYQVVPMGGRRCPRPVGPALAIDYGLGGNGRFDLMHFLVDPIVAVNEGSHELLLGWSYLDFGLLRISTPNFFVLERERALTHSARPKRA